MLCRIRHDDSPSLITDHWLVTTALRRDLPHHTAAHPVVAIRQTAGGGGAVEIAVRIENGTERVCAVSAPGEVMERGVGPTAIRGCQLENRAVSLVPEAVTCAVEVTSGIHHQLVLGTALPAAGQVIERVEGPAAVGRREFENNASPIVAAAGGSRPIEIAGWINQQPSHWIYPSGEFIEAIKCLLRPVRSRGRQFVNRSESVLTAALQDTVEVAGTVEDDPSLRVCAFTVALGMKHGPGPRAARRRQFINDAIVVSAAISCGAVDIS